MVPAKMLAVLRAAYAAETRPALRILTLTVRPLLSRCSHARLLQAIHIDYANRPESGREAAFVVQWSVEQGFCCRVRVVDEVARGVTQYEKVD
jgi:hypothetical protein